jgi:hypothetical protein
MTFDAEAAKLKCTHCGNVQEMPENFEEDIVESDYHSALLSLEESEDSEVRITVSCDNCGAEVAFNENIVVDKCAYCDSPITAQHRSHRMLKPSYLLPFGLTERQAAENFKKWLSSRWFLPGKVKERANMMKMDGIYTPFWTYDTGTITDYSGSSGEYYWVNETYTTTDSDGKSVKKTRRVRKTRWYPARGTVGVNFDDVLTLGSKSLPRKYTEALEPWDLHSLVPYEPSYLSGFRVESYGIGVEEGFEDAKEKMLPDIHKEIKRDIGGDVQRIYSTRIDYNDITFKHILLPIWISAFRFDRKVYRFVVNARTGEVQGERPWSWVKITLFILMILAVIGAVVGLISLFGK